MFIKDDIKKTSVIGGHLNEAIIDLSFGDNKYAKTLQDYSDELDKYGLPYRKVDYYYQIGEIGWVQGWILDLSIVQSQMKDALEVLLPYFISCGLCFKIARTSDKARSLSNGEYGAQSLGKTICVYPPPLSIVNTAHDLINLTKKFKGPRILTDRYLGGVVYTRFGQGDPVIKISTEGISEKFIYASNGELISDSFDIPFKLPEGISWPFAKFADAKEPKPQTVLQDKYKPIYLLKDDVKGRVRKGLLLGKGLTIKWCVIKEGKMYMISDEIGRDIHDRMKWQYELQIDLEDKLPLPKVYDLFSENGDSYLVMQFLKGVVLDDIIASTFNGRRWSELPKHDRLKLLGFAIQVTEMISTLHSNGYIHRDITPANFMVTKGDKLYMIDLELSYSKKIRKPFPPFRLGTPGFMSPEQEISDRPSEEQDIYSIGALLIYILTGLTPVKFAQQNIESLQQQIGFFINNEMSVDVISRCFEIDPMLRPKITEIKKALECYKREQEMGNDEASVENILLPSKQVFNDMIGCGLKGIFYPGMMSHEGFWVSKKYLASEFNPGQVAPVAVYPGYFHGVSGILFLLARAHELGFNINIDMQHVQQNLSFVKKYFHNKKNELQSGFYFGSAGIAFALCEGIQSGLINITNDTIDELREYLDPKKLLGIGIATGSAGHGMALLKARHMVGDEFVCSLLDQHLEEIINLQQPDGSWVTAMDNRKRPLKLTGFSNGVSGIVIFLLEYLKLFKNEASPLVKETARRGLDWLVRNAKEQPGTLMWVLNNKTREVNAGFQEGCAGIILALIKGFEFFGEEKYRMVASRALKKYPLTPVHADITYAEGLTGFAEVCLEAARVFKSDMWQQYVNWVVQFLIHQYNIGGNGACYWITDKSQVPTAGLMTGSSGIIHFLMRCANEKLSHPLLG